ncbi:hypothetical protein RF11_07170 [Thelohanellus kitauei]|uniref:Uncharacterized protein n=1 Tax=Thelohanellus kitauei TaxID=669202 RepID=A0A0C2NJN9_THEKT|nr:hypothetical protein RF11_07170 [Thelohanellus kitauei]
MGTTEVWSKMKLKIMGEIIDILGLVQIVTVNNRYDFPCITEYLINIFFGVPFLEGFCHFADAELYVGIQNPGIMLSILLDETCIMVQIFISYIKVKLLNMSFSLAAQRKWHISSVTSDIFLIARLNRREGIESHLEIEDESLNKPLCKGHSRWIFTKRWIRGLPNPNSNG